MKSFIDKLIAGAISAKQVETHINKWLNDKRIKKDLHEYLGFTWDEYVAFITEKKTLKQIVLDREKNAN